ncbi:MAG: acyl-CoA desaturase, partial [Myxococcales bacterium]|nr:acyl-CoA desaturase [Myxococcales bacterium]
MNATLQAPPRLEARDDRFLSALREAVRARLDDPALERRAFRRAWAKAALLGVWFAASYAAALASTGTAALGIASASAGLALAGLAFNVQHDGAHGSLPGGARANRAAALVLDFLGMSSTLWHWKHNHLHHGHPNVRGLDDDVDAGPVARLHPEDPWRPHHRWQHLYLWPSYALLTLRWIFYSDPKEYLSGRIGTFRLPPLTRRQRLGFWLGKLLFVGWALLVPIAVLGPARGLAFFLLFEMVGGFVAAVAFQLAHAVEDAAPHGEAAPGDAAGWAERQLAATVDFTTWPRFLGGYLGGLNHQSVHHLFPGVSHQHYPWMADLLAETARAHGVRY